jgi:hypothetical protein
MHVLMDGEGVHDGGFDLPSIAFALCLQPEGFI